MRELGYVSPAPLIGQRVRIAGRIFHVIGVMAPRGRAETGGDPDLQVIVPLRAGRFQLFGTDHLNDIYVLAASDAEVPLAMTESDRFFAVVIGRRPMRPTTSRFAISRIS